MAGAAGQPGGVAGPARPVWRRPAIQVGACPRRIARRLSTRAMLRPRARAAACGASLRSGWSRTRQKARPAARGPNATFG